MMEGSRGCIGKILPTSASSVMHRQASVNLSGYGEQEKRALKRKRDAWLRSDSQERRSKFRTLPNGKLTWSEADEPSEQVHPIGAKKPCAPTSLSKRPMQHTRSSSYASPTTADQQAKYLPHWWTVGALFKFRNNTCHRVYEGPPDGTPRVRIGQDELFVDFNGTFRVSGIYVNTTFTAVSFKVAGVSKDDSSESELDDIYSDKPPGTAPTTVWTNVRKRDVWWAKVVSASDLDAQQDEPNHRAWT
jgi:hypothetical protein